MIQITMTPDEPAKLITFMEKTYSVNLEILQNLLNNTDITASITLIKSIPGVTAPLQISIMVKR